MSKSTKINAVILLLLKNVVTKALKPSLLGLLMDGVPEELANQIDGLFYDEENGAYAEVDANKVFVTYRALKVMEDLALSGKYRPGENDLNKSKNATYGFPQTSEILKDRKKIESLSDEEILDLFMGIHGSFKSVEPIGHIKIKDSYQSSSTPTFTPVEVLGRHNLYSETKNYKIEIGTEGKNVPLTVLAHVLGKDELARSGVDSLNGHTIYSVDEGFSYLNDVA